MDNKLAVIGSELPVLQAKGTYKYLKEITGNGAYYQVSLLSSGLAKISWWLHRPLWHDPDSNQRSPYIEWYFWRWGGVDNAE